MPWQVLAIREVDDGGDGVLYPLPGTAPNTITLDDQDGTSTQAPVVVARSFLLREVHPGAKAKMKMVGRAEKIDLAVFVTDARVALACTAFDKGGGWVGADALVLNALSRAHA